MMLLTPKVGLQKSFYFNYKYETFSLNLIKSFNEKIMAVKQVSKKTQETSFLLLSANENEILKGLKQAKEHGSADMIPVIVKLAQFEGNDSITKSSYEILYNLKDEKSIPFLLEEIKKIKDDSYKAAITASLWESGLNTNNYIEEITELAINSEYLTCLECLTIIENIKGDIDSEKVENSIKSIGDHLIHAKKEDTVLLVELKKVLETLLIG